MYSDKRHLLYTRVHDMRINVIVLFHDRNKGYSQVPIKCYINLNLIENKINFVQIMLLIAQKNF